MYHVWPPGLVDFFNNTGPTNFLRWAQSTIGPIPHRSTCWSQNQNMVPLNPAHPALWRQSGDPGESLCGKSTRGLGWWHGVKLKRFHLDLTMGSLHVVANLRYFHCGQWGYWWLASGWNGVPLASKLCSTIPSKKHELFLVSISKESVYLFYPLLTSQQHGFQH